jgi:hypothetical protein
MSFTSLLSARPSKKDIHSIFKNQELALPDLKEMQGDINRIIESVARRYTDQTCYALRYDDLVAEGRAKLALMIDRDTVSRMKSRQEFFRYFKTAINNHIKSLVQRHRGTLKRMGTCANGAKPEVSIDAEDDDHEPMQLGTSDPRIHELIEDMRTLFSPLENMVLDQMIDPNDPAIAAAYIDAYRGKQRSDRDLRVKVKPRHLAYGLGISLAEFLNIQDRIQRKLKMAPEEEDTQRNRAIALLEQTYGVCVPPYTEDVVVKRLFTLVARDKFEKLDDDVRQALAAVGARAPEKGLDGKSQACYGVLYQSPNKACDNCALRQACAVEAANYGLGDIVISPKLMSAQAMMRMPVMNVTVDDEGGEKEDEAMRHGVVDDPVVENVRDEQILAYLKDTLKEAAVHGQKYYRLATPKVKYILRIHQIPERSDVCLCFCKPSPSLLAKLETVRRCHYLPARMNYREAIALIEQHIHEATADNG